MSGIKHYRKAVLKGKSGFDLLFSRGRWLNGREISMRVTRISGTELKLAVCVSRKTAPHAVRRSRLRRIARVAIDPFVERMKIGHYIAFFPREAFDALRPDERSGAVGTLVRQAGLIDESRSPV